MSNNIGLNSLSEIIKNKINRIEIINKRVFLFNILTFWKFINENFITKEIIQDVLADFPEIDQEVNKIIERKKFPFNKEQKEVIAIACKMIDNLSKQTVIDQDNYISLIGLSIDSPKDYKETCRIVFDSLFKHVGYYIIDKIDADLLLLIIAKRFKIKSEQFNKAKLNKIFDDNHSQGESNLALVFNEYLFDNGFDVYSEPKTISGRIDFVIIDNQGRKVLSDAKIFDGNGRSKSYIINGVSQVLTHIKEDNLDIGLLLIYEISNKSLQFNLPRRNNIPYVTIDNKLIFIIIIDIFRYDKTASKRGKQEFIQINESDLIE